MTRSRFSRPSLAIALVAATVAFAACSDRGLTEPGALPDPSAAAAAQTFGATLLQCPSSSSTSASGVVTPLGGVVVAGGTVITVPAGAVLVPTVIEVTVPASNYVEADISVPGVEHFVFEVPVTISVSYARCNRNDINATPLSAWYIDTATKTLLENMGGVDDKVNKRVTFTTPHLSGYALAN